MIRTGIFDWVHCRWVYQWITHARWASLRHLTLTASLVCTGGFIPPVPPVYAVTPPPPSIPTIPPENGYYPPIPPGGVEYPPTGSEYPPTGEYPPPSIPTPPSNWYPPNMPQFPQFTPPTQSNSPPPVVIEGDMSPPTFGKRGEFNKFICDTKPDTPPITITPPGPSPHVPEPPTFMLFVMALIALGLLICLRKQTLVPQTRVTLVMGITYLTPVKGKLDV